MKVLLLAVVLMAAGPVWGQDLKTAAGADPGAANWSQLGPSIEGTKGYTLFGRGIRLDRSGQYELWVKIVPENTSNFVKRYSLPRTTVYVMQHATVDCEKRLLLLEKTSAFDSGDREVQGSISSLTPGSKRGAVRPGSIGESIYRYVCVDATSLPMKRT